MSEFQNGQFADAAINCHTLYSCFMYSASYGLRMGGGMGDNMNVISRTDEDFYARLVFDMAFFMLINLVFMNIVFGIIVDTFSQMRDEYDQRKLDASDNCFVCG
jgi:preprotein translocase subunit SecG